ncbi:C40 family peptidase [Clostridium sp. 'White wine YQ']|uniref:C40 family peptidase n=1 Tax=Clostridium sp. 'White wine YQ' TaxID=3027474 RepID=UPI002365A37F|nr:C40 family peptidase [Clostridium sp. 'White wine YQ']MDD7795724.1 NlpC/P60 family protein [Clostridium sp. 'White wine YQ']
MLDKKKRSIFSNKKGVTLLITAVFLIGGNTPVFAEPIFTKEQQQQYDESSSQYSKAQDELNELQNKVDGIVKNIQEVQVDIDKNNSEISNIKNEINELNKDIEKTKNDLEVKEKNFGVRLRQLYKSGGEKSYIIVLLNAKSIGDFISKAEAISKLMSMDKKVIDELNDKKEECANKISEMEDKNKELEKLNKDNQVKIEELGKKQDEQNVYVDEVKSKMEIIAKDLAPLERLEYKAYEPTVNSPTSKASDLSNVINILKNIRKNIKTPEVDSEIANLIDIARSRIESGNCVQDDLINRGGISGSNLDVVSYATQFIGARYVSPGNPPYSFDCSGLVQYVYRHFGIGLPRTTWDQVNYGTPVSYSELQAGDLVFTNGNGHVGIYVGGGQMIHASMPGVGVIQGPIYHFVTARRVR